MAKYKLITNTGYVVPKFSFDRLTDADIALYAYEKEINLKVSLCDSIPPDTKYFRIQSDNQSYQLIFDPLIIECAKHTKSRGGIVQIDPTTPEFLTLCSRIQQQIYNWIYQRELDDSLEQLKQDIRIDEKFFHTIYQYSQGIRQPVDSNEDLLLQQENWNLLCTQLRHYKKLRAYILATSHMKKPLYDFSENPENIDIYYLRAKESWKQVYGTELSYEEYQKSFASAPGRHR